MQSGAALLKQWVERRGYSQVEAAEILGLHESFMSMLVRGHRIPSLTNAIRIERLTGIPVSAWASSAVDKSVSKRRVVEYIDGRRG